MLDRLWEAGQRTIPGGGAEILSERVRTRIAPKKGGPGAWLEVHREAHRRGFKSTATMMYGHVEETRGCARSPGRRPRASGRVRRLYRLRALVVQAGQHAAGEVDQALPGPQRLSADAGRARLYLDNFAHVQASWFSEGKRTGQIALHFGADDWGGTLFEENVHKAADYVNTITVEEMTTLIREAGFTPVQRTTTYQILREW